MRRSKIIRACAIRALVVCASAGVAISALPAAASAQELPPVKPVSLRVTATGATIDYSVTHVPNRRSTFPVIRGDCTTAAIDTIAAAPVLAPAAIDTASGRQLDVPVLLERLIAAKAIAAGPRIQLASTAGEITGAFTDIPRGIYAVMTICNINPFGFEFDPDLFEISPTVVTDLRSGS